MQSTSHPRASQNLTGEMAIQDCRSRGKMNQGFNLGDEATERLTGTDVLAHLQDVLVRQLTLPTERLEGLLPDVWFTALPHAMWKTLA